MAAGSKTATYWNAQSVSYLQWTISDCITLYFEIVFDLRNFLHSMEKKSTKVDFSPISCKKAPFYIVNWTFKGMLLLSYLASLDNKPRTWL